MVITAFCDGGYHTKEDIFYGSYTVFISDAERVIETKHKKFNLPYVKTSNEAEYLAVLVTLAFVANKYPDTKSIYIFSDSRFVVLQVNDIWNAKKYKLIYDKISKLKKKFNDFNLAWIPKKMIVRILGH